MRQYQEWHKQIKSLYIYIYIHDCVVLFSQYKQSLRNISTVLHMIQKNIYMEINTNISDNIKMKKKLI